MFKSFYFTGQTKLQFYSSSLLVAMLKMVSDKNAFKEKMLQGVRNVLIYQEAQNKN